MITVFWQQMREMATCACLRSERGQTAEGGWYPTSRARVHADIRRRPCRVGERATDSTIARGQNEGRPTAAPETPPPTSTTSVTAGDGGEKAVAVAVAHIAQKTLAACQGQEQEPKRRRARRPHRRSSSEVNLKLFQGRSNDSRNERTDAEEAGFDGGRPTQAGESRDRKPMARQRNASRNPPGAPGGIHKAYIPPVRYGVGSASAMPHTFTPIASASTFVPPPSAPP